MIRFLVPAAAIALAACGGGAGEANNAAPADAAANRAEMLPNELADDTVSGSNLANAAAEAAPPAAPAAQPARKAEPGAGRRRPAAPTAPIPTTQQTEPDPHAGHDMNDM